MATPTSSERHWDRACLSTATSARAFRRRIGCASAGDFLRAQAHGRRFVSGALILLVLPTALGGAGSGSP